MNIPSNSLHVSVIDIFSILLPGAVLTYLVHWIFGPGLIEPVLHFSDNMAEGWLVFLFGAYLIGHIVFLIGSFLDEALYDPIREKIWPKVEDRTLQAIITAKGRASVVSEKKVINAFQWAKARLLIQHPHALLSIHRLEADAKFFRSLVVVLLALLIFAAVVGLWMELIAAFILLLLSIWRYIERRYKSTKRAYELVLTLDHLPTN